MKKRISMTTSIVFGVKKHTNTNKCFININFIISKKIKKKSSFNKNISIFLKKYYKILRGVLEILEQKQKMSELQNLELQTAIGFEGKFSGLIKMIALIKV